MGTLSRLNVEALEIAHHELNFLLWQTYKVLCPWALFHETMVQQLGITPVCFPSVHLTSHVDMISQAIPLPYWYTGTINYGM